MKQTIRRQLAAILTLSMTLALCACRSPGSAKKSAPDNESCNNGFYAIMETESGYYLNYWGIQNLRYYDKESGNEIYLCPKPECLHEGGESCVATYRNLRVVNSVLYNGAIYILSTEEEGTTAGFYLYRIALDGSTLDKVGCAFSAENTNGEETFWVGDVCHEGSMPMFIIHRGYAYIPFFLSFKHSIMGFVNGGIIKMDITNGKTEQIYTMSDFHDSCPQKLRACGKYVFFDLYCARYDKEYGTLCYDSESGEVFCPFGEDFADAHLFSNMETEEAVYNPNYATADDGLYIQGLLPYKITSGEQEPLEQRREKQILFDNNIAGRNSNFEMKLYENRLFVFTEDRAAIYSSDGRKLGEIVNPPDVDEPYQYTRSNCAIFFQITGGKLYAVCRPTSKQLENLHANQADIVVYSCPIEDILAGNGTWALAYTISSEWLPYSNDGHNNGFFMPR